MPGCAVPRHVHAEKVSFNQVNRKTGHRIKYLKVDADTGEEVEAEDIMKGYKADIDPRYAIRPYYLVPDGKVGHDAYAVIRETIRQMDMVAIGRLVLTGATQEWTDGDPASLSLRSPRRR